MTPLAKRRAILTVDLEDYRRDEMVRLTGAEWPPSTDEVVRQVDLVLAAFDACGATATFFSVGRLAREMPRATWDRLTRSHTVGCHGHEHVDVRRLGADRFLRDLIAAKSALEDVCGRAVVSFRAPYFSSDGCDPWFGEALAWAGFRLDSSRRVASLPKGVLGQMALPGSGGAVTEVPFHSIGIGVKRLTVIGGTYFRLLPIEAICALFSRAESLRFIPMIYLHPYDIDQRAAPLPLPRSRSVARVADRIRRTGRATVEEKLRQLSATYSFEPIESVGVS